MDAGTKILVIGYGNPGRLDDGLGPAFAAAVEALQLSNVTVESNYHLTVEDAQAVAEHNVVIFADAALAGAEPFEVRSIQPKVSHRFSTHGVDPEAVLGLAHDIFGAATQGYTLAIRGYAFDDFGERLSDGARRNLAAAVAALCPQPGGQLNVNVWEDRSSSRIETPQEV